jgi:hypothetical protein
MQPSTMHACCSSWRMACVVHHRVNKDPILAPKYVLWNPCINLLCLTTITVSRAAMNRVIGLRELLAVRTRTCCACPHVFPYAYASFTWGPMPLCVPAHVRAHTGSRTSRSTPALISYACRSRTSAPTRMHVNPAATSR